MAQKNASPNRYQREILRKNGFNPAEYVVVRELREIIIVKNRQTKEIEKLGK